MRFLDIQLNYDSMQAPEYYHPIRSYREYQDEVVSKMIDGELVEEASELMGDFLSCTDDSVERTEKLHAEIIKAIIDGKDSVTLNLNYLPQQMKDLINDFVLKNAETA